MHNGIFVPRRIALFWFLATAHLCLLNRCDGQHYFFEEIKKINTTIGGEQNTTGENYVDENDSFISFENATLLQDDQPKESILQEIKFPDFYHAQGIISLPYDGIIEPFEAWYAGRHKMSRIDYYYGNRLLFT